MQLGKQLRSRAIFGRGRALIGLIDHGMNDPVSLVRSFARSGMDAIVASPGVLEGVADDLEMLAVILRLNTISSRSQQFLTVQAALEMGAVAVLLTVDAHDARDLERLGRVTEEARRLGMPVAADMLGEDLRASVIIAAEFGADIVQVQCGATHAELKAAIRVAGRPVQVVTGGATAEPLIRLVHECLEAGAQGVVVEPDIEPVLAAIQGLVHQGTSLEEALQTTRPPKTADAAFE